MLRRLTVEPVPCEQEGHLVPLDFVPL